jgi:hypothetical protein
MRRAGVNAEDPDPHAARREERGRREREGMLVHGRSVRRLAELSARPGHVSSAAAAASPAAKRRRRSKRRRRRA